MEFVEKPEIYSEKSFGDIYACYLIWNNVVVLIFGLNFIALQWPFLKEARELRNVILIWSLGNLAR